MRIDHPLALTQLGFHIDYSTEFGWIASRDGKSWSVEGKDAWKAAPLLELAPDEMTQKMAEIRADVPAGSPFPLTELLRWAFASHSSYWAEKAAEWYPYLPDEGKEQLSAELSELALGRWATQRTRQFAKREVRKLTR